MMMLEKVKTLLGIEDDLQDNLLELLIENVETELVHLLKQAGYEPDDVTEPIPSELNYIVLQVVVIRFNKLGTEGMKSESVEGHRIEFYEQESDFNPYLSIISSYGDDDVSDGKGRVMFI